LKHYKTLQRNVILRKIQNRSEIQTKSSTANILWCCWL